MRFWKLTRCPCGSRGAIAAEWRKMSSALRVWNGLRRCEVWLVFAFLLLAVAPAQAIQSVRIPLDATAIDLTKAVENYGAQGDRLLVSTAPGSDGIVRRIEVRALEPGSHPNWIVFALTNDTDEQIERLVVAPHFRLVGSGVISPISAPRAFRRSPRARAFRRSAWTALMPMSSA